MPIPTNMPPKYTRKIKLQGTVGLGVLSFLFFGSAFAATILQTQTTDTLDTFRTNVNTSLVNLNAAIPAAGSTYVATTSLVATYPIKATATSASINYSLLDMATSSGTVSSPLTGNFICVGTSCTLGIQQGNASQSGYISSTDWTNFNGKLGSSSLPWSIANGGTNQTSFTNGQPLSFDGTRQVSTTTTHVSYASSTAETTAALWDTGITSALGLWDANHLLGAYGGSNPCSNQVALSISAVGVISCTSITDAMFSGQLGISHGGTNQTSFTNGQPISFNGTSLVSTTTLVVTSASSTNNGVSSFFDVQSGARSGIGSSTPSSLFGVSIGTTTMVQGAQIAAGYASSTTDNTTETVNWNNGNSQRYILTQNTSFSINSTSSNPLDGGRYVLKLCQDGTGSRTVTFGNAASMSWGTNGTTTVTSTANKCTLIGMIYDGTNQIYNVVASSTAQWK